MRDGDLANKLARNKGFTSLRPLFDETNTEKILEWATAKKERIEKQRKRILSASGRVAPCEMARVSNLLDGIDSEDELIKDPSFAALLNEKREISVADKAYKYTYEGTYITDKGNLGSVYNYIENTSYSEIAQLPLGTNDVGNGVTLLRIAPIDDCGGGNTGGGSTTSGCRTPSCGVLQWSPEDDLTICANQASDFWTDIFGPKVKCYSYFEDKRRLKTEAWDQNYTIYTSVGMKAVSQHRVAWVWWQSEISLVSVGVDLALLKYQSLKIEWPSVADDIYYIKDGIYFDESGNTILAESKSYHPVSMYDEWPFKNVNEEFFKIFDYSGTVSDAWEWEEVSITGEKLNKYVKKGITAILQGVIGGVNTQNPPYTMVHTQLKDNNTGESDVYFVVGNLTESNSNANKAVYRFDWATGQIGFTLGFEADPGRTGGYNGNTSVGLKKAEKSFSAMKMVGFGYGYRNGVLRGDKVVFVKE